MKKVLILLVVFILFPKSIYALSARNAIAMDMDTNRILYEHDINSKHLIASISKIMTAIIAIENKDINSEVTITDSVLKSFGSGIYVEVGETIKLKDLLYGLMLRSGNDAAIAISEYVAPTIDDFVLLMNEKAKSLGMNNTNFINPHGLENESGEGNTSTAYDMAKLSSYAMQNEIYKEIVATKNYTCKSSLKTYSWTNKNKMLINYEYTTGGKTGFTQKARRTLVSTASKDNVNITVVTLNDPDDWSDHKYLYETLFKEYKSVLILDKKNFKVNNEIYYKDDKLYIKNDVYLTLKENEKKDIILDIILDKMKEYKNDDCVGVVKIKLLDKILKEEKIYVSKKDINTKKTLKEKIKDWFKHD